MPDDNKYRVLCTRPLKSSLIAAARENGVDISAHAFIAIKPLQEQALINDLPNATGRTLVFTSNNAVEILHRQYLAGKQLQKPQVCCISGKTKQAVLEAFPDSIIAAAAPYGKELAAAIIQLQSIHEVSFFCGSQRRNDLPDALKNAGITVHEYVVYETVATPVVAAEDYDGVMFFSPSAVNSYFSVNTLPPATVCFAIGHTTAAVVKEHTGNKIITSAGTDEQSMVQTAVLYFNNI
jgi:uroporphyrinogen-III synthase